MQDDMRATVQFDLETNPGRRSNTGEIHSGLTLKEMMKEKYQSLCEHARKTALLESTAALLEWDQQTNLPASASSWRGEQITLLAGEIHRRKTCDEFGTLITELSETSLVADSESDEASVIRELKREFDRNTKVPPELVEEIAKATAMGYGIWVESRKNNDFATFEPILQKIVELKQQQADAIGYQSCRYDALLDEYEPGATTSGIKDVFAPLRDQLTSMLEMIKGANRTPDTHVLRRTYPADAQRQFAKKISKKIGFDYDRGRLDETQHPFCTELGPDDCRILTRYDETFFGTGFFGTLHEAGHGMYEQGLRGDQYGLPTGKYCSLGIHESQSRLWENLVGRSDSFWQYAFPLAQSLFSNALEGVSREDFFRAVNAVEPSLIRVEADEATYNLHIIIRFELECELIEGNLRVSDVPQAWNEKYRSHLGVQSPTFSDGVLQDVHWSAGLFGYFPTYTLGNLYASQLFESADRQLGGLADLIAVGDFRPLRIWLKENVYQCGRKYSSVELGKRATGQPISHESLISDLKRRLYPVYGL